MPYGGDSLSPDDSRSDMQTSNEKGNSNMKKKVYVIPHVGVHLIACEASLLSSSQIPVAPEGEGTASSRYGF